MNNKWWIAVPVVVGLVVAYFAFREPPPCTGDECEPDPITFGCRVSTAKWHKPRKGANAKFYARTEQSMSSAREAAKEEYAAEVPEAAKLKANCWDCDRTDLDEDAREVCNR